MKASQQNEDSDWYSACRPKLYDKYGAGWVIIHNRQVRAVCRSYEDGIRFAENVLGYEHGEYIVRELTGGGHGTTCDVGGEEREQKTSKRRMGKRKSRKSKGFKR